MICVYFVLVAIATLLPSARSLDLTNQTYVSQVTSELSTVKDELIKRNPEISQWLERTKLRLQNPQNASEDDINEVRESLLNLQKEVYDYVTSPKYNITGIFATEKAVTLLEPILGLFPLKELRQLFDLVQKDPEMVEIVAEVQQNFMQLLNSSEEEIHSLMPVLGAAMLGEIKADTDAGKIKASKELRKAVRGFNKVSTQC